MTKSQLLDHVQKLEDSYNQLESSYNHTQQENEYLKFRISGLQRLLYGSKRERFISNQAVWQKKLPFEDQIEESEQEPKKEKEKVEYYREKPKKKHPGRADFPDHLPVEEVWIEPECSAGGLEKPGYETKQELDYDPGKVYIRKFIRPKFADPVSETVIIGDRPFRPINKGIAGPGLLAQLFVDKYVDHLPNYRQRQGFKRENINISSSTINSWTKQTADLADGLFQRLKNKILNEGYLQVDETPIKVLDKTKKGTAHQGYYWVYYSPMRRAVFFDYRYGRSREGPKQLLKDFTGYLQTDGYQAYDWFGRQEDITLVGCWAHARRQFEKALDYDRERAGLHSGAGRAGMFYSFFGTCRQHGVNPWKWLKRVLELLPGYPASQLDDLLPQNSELD